MHSIIQTNRFSNCRLMGVDIMKAIPSRLFAISSAVGICLLGQSVYASPVTLVQNYGFESKFQATLQILNTLLTISVKYDEGSLSGTGDEFIPAESIDLLFSDRGLTGLPTGLTATNAVGNGSGAFIPVSGFTALYSDGVFQSFSSNAGKGILSAQVVFDGGPVFDSIFLSAGGGILRQETPNGADS